MAKDFLFTWRCPLCNSVGNGKFTTGLIARRWGRKHFHLMHKKDDMTGLEPIVERVLVRGEKRKNFEKLKELNDDIWYEIDQLPSFFVSAQEKLIIPHHVFVTKKIYRKILKQGV